MTTLSDLKKVDFPLYGISGTNGAGKDLLCQALEEKRNFYFISVSDLFRAEARKRGIAVERVNLAMISAEWRRQGGLGVMIEKPLEVYLQVAGQYDGLVISSLRNPGEADAIHKYGGKVIWVDADPEVRYQRIASVSREGRGEEDQKTFDEFMADERREMHSTGDDATLDMAGVKAKADIFIENNGFDIEAFKKEALTKL